MGTHKGGKNGTKKTGRNKVKCERYRSQRRREHNKIRKLTRYLRKHVNDKQTAKRLVEIKMSIGIFS